MLYPRTTILRDYDTEIVIPLQQGTYQYLIEPEKEVIEDIIVTRILEDLYRYDIKNSKIMIGDVYLSKNARTILNRLSFHNTIEFISKKDFKKVNIRSVKDLETKQ